MQRSCLPLTAKERVQLPCRTAETSREGGRASAGSERRRSSGATAGGLRCGKDRPENGDMHNNQRGWARQPASGPRRGYGRTGASPRDGPGPFGDAGAKGTGTGPLGQPMRPQPRRCARHGAGAPAPRHFLPDRVRHRARGGRDGDGTGAFGAGQPGNTGGANSARSANMPANRQAGFRPERSEAGTEAGGRRRIQARVGSTTHNTGEVGRRPHRAISCRTASGTGRGSGSRPAGLSRVGPIQRVSAIPAATPNMPLSGRSAQRRPADGC